MKRKSFIALLASISLLFSLAVSPLSSAAVNSEEALIPAGPLGFISARLPEKIKKKLEPLIEKFIQQNQDERTKIFLETFLKGSRLVFAITDLSKNSSTPVDLLLITTMSDENWLKLNSGKETETYGSATIYFNQEEAGTKLGNYVVMSQNKDELKKAIDLYDAKSTDSVLNTLSYQVISGKYLPSPFFTLYMDIPPELFDTLSEMTETQAVEIEGVEKAEPQEQFGVEEVEEEELGVEAVKEMPGVEPVLKPEEAAKEITQQSAQTEQGIKMLKTIWNLLDGAGISVAETPNGYAFNLIGNGNEVVLRKRGISFNPGGNFTPNLYKKFPNAKPILYAEGFNPKANWDSEQKFLKDFEQNGMSYSALFEEFKKQSGVDIPKIYQTFEKGIAWGIQYNPSKPYPYFTIMAEAGERKTDVIALAAELKTALTKALKKAEVKGLKITTSGDITKIIFDIAEQEGYDGPPFPKFEVTFGVTEDGLFVISNYPDIEEPEKRQGFGADADFIANLHGPVSNISYLNARNAWGFMDHFVSWIEKVGGDEHSLPLEFYQNYYGMLEKLYAWKDLLIIEENTETMSVLKGEITLDNAKHESYEDVMSKFKSSDKDGDGISDFEEKFVYKTSSDSGDKDNDGISDFEEIKKGGNPAGEGRLFKDVKENDWYADEVGMSWNRGVVKGYEDQTFKPGQLVTRAEFTAMIVRGFEEDTSKFLGFEVELRGGANPFSDIAGDMWFVNPVTKAFNAKWVQGNLDENGKIIFRPMESITRAEAVAILNRASKMLKESKMGLIMAGGPKPLPFKDISEEQWFYLDVANAYQNEITTGKRPDAFEPLSPLARAEAAALIFRTLNFEIEKGGSETSLPLGFLPQMSALPIGK